MSVKTMFKKQQSLPSAIFICGCCFGPVWVPLVSPSFSLFFSVVILVSSFSAGAHNRSSHKNHTAKAAGVGKKSYLHPKRGGSQSLFS